MAKRLKKKINNVSDLDEAVRKTYEIYEKVHPITIYVVDSKPIRSLPQNKYFHGVVVKCIADMTGYSPDLTKQILKHKFGIDTEHKRMKDGTVLTLYKSTSKYSKEEMTKFIEECIMWAWDVLNLHIPSPDELAEADFYTLIENDLI